MSCGVQISFWDNVFNISLAKYYPKVEPCTTSSSTFTILSEFQIVFPSRLNQFTSANHAQGFPFHCGLICIFLINDILYLLIPVDHLYVFIEKNIHSDFGPFFNYFFFATGVVWVLYVFWMLPYMIWAYLLPIPGHADVLMASFTVKLLIWYSPTCLFLLILFGVRFKHHCQDSMSRSPPPVFLL